MAAAPDPAGHAMKILSGCSFCGLPIEIHPAPARGMMIDTHTPCISALGAELRSTQQELGFLQRLVAASLDEGERPAVEQLKREFYRANGWAYPEPNPLEGDQE